MSARSSAHRTTARQTAPATRQRRAVQRRQRRLSRLLAWLLSAVLGTAGLAYAQVPANTLPSGGRVVVGSAQLQQGGNQLVVNQNTARLGVDWQSFSIGSGATVEFRQPGRDSVALNRVVGNSGSEIYGQLRANGQVFLVNPNGVLFAPGAKVDVGGLVASTLDITQADFAAGRYQFNATGAGGTVSNQGELRASAGGYLALFGQQVDNQGSITVDAGQVVLASGRAATVSISGNGLISAVVSPGAAGSVSNSGLVQADGGVVTMTARSAEGLAASLVNNSGIVRANSIEERNGEVWITGDQVSSSGTISADATGAGDAGKVKLLGGMDGGSLALSGSITARSDRGRGGEVETSAAQVSIAPGARVNTLSGAGTHGTWTIDPIDFTVAAGSGALGTAGIGADTLATNLNSGNVVLAAAQGGAGDTDAGDIHVNAAVSWSANTTLTLNAIRDVNVNANISSTHASGGGLAINPGNGGAFNLATGSRITLAGSGATLAIGGVQYTLLRTLTDLVGVNASNTTRSGNYALAADLDASASAALNNGLGFTPIGNASGFGSNNSFRGRFDGLGNSIVGLTVNQPTNSFVGLFGTAHDATIRNLTLSGGAFTGRQYVGAVVGYAAASGNVGAAPMTITNVHSNAPVSQATVVGNGNAGGLVGQFAAASGSIARSTASGSVTTVDSSGNFGGLVGYVSGGTVSGVQGVTTASGAVTMSSTSNSRSAGGLIGAMDGAGTLSNVSASGDVSSAYNAGGLVGWYSSTGAASNLQATGNVTGTNYVGGLIGDWNAAGAITTATASGSVTGAEHVGGLIGRNTNSGSLTGGSASGNVSSSINGTTYVGGLVGYFISNVAGAQIVNGSATGSVTTTSPYGYVGGLVGRLYGNSLSGGTASGAVTSSSTVDSRAVGGLVGSVENGGSVSNGQATGNVGSGYHAGGLIGYLGGNGSVSNSTASGSVTGIHYVGGLIGNWESGSSGSVSASHANGSAAVTSGEIAGGLIGRAYAVGTLSNVSAASRSVTGATYAGGLAGYYYGGNLTNVSAGGSVATTVTGNTTVYMGGLVGYYYSLSGVSTIQSATATASVTSGAGYGNYGGLIGYAYNTNILGTDNGTSITRTSASGAVTLTNTAVNSSRSAGGLVGYYDGSGRMDMVGASGAVSGGYYVGGLIGYHGATGNLRRALATGHVAGTGLGTEYVGGLVGFMSSAGAIDSSEAQGNVSTRYDGGGLVGYWSSSSGSVNGTTVGIIDSRATGNVTGSRGAESLGGLVGYGYNNGRIENSGATGNVTGGRRAGGLAGYLQYTNIKLSTASGTVSSTGDSTVYVGGLVGDYYQYNAGATIEDSSASGRVYGDGPSVYAGGLLGQVSSSTLTIINSSASGRVTATDSADPNRSSHYAGGLVGEFSGVGMTDVSATGQVEGRTYAGGLAGYYNATGTLTNATASGAVSGIGSVGGLIGVMGRGSIVTARATGSVMSTSTSGAVGGLIGAASPQTGDAYTDVRASGNVSGGDNTGGLLGNLYDYYSSTGGSPLLTDARASGSVTGSGYSGGLVGYLYGYYGNGRGIRSAEASGRVEGVYAAGGLVGWAYISGGIQDSHASGDAVLIGSTTSDRYAGGLVGSFQSSASAGVTAGQLARNWASGSVSLDPSATLGSSADIYAGGLAGYVTGPSGANVTLRDSYATGAVSLLNSTGRMRAGGLVGYISTSLANSYSTGGATATGLAASRQVGGLVGQRASTSNVATASYWATDSSGNATSVIGTGATLAQLRTASFFPTGGSGWDIATAGGSSSVWRIYDGFTTPLLRAQLTPLTLTLANLSKVYDGTAGVGAGAINFGGTAVAFPERIFFGGSGSSANVGSYALTAANLYSNQIGYDLTLAGTATLTITPRPLSIDGLIADKVYDGTTAATLASNPRFVGLVAGESLAFQAGPGFAAAFDTKTVGTAKSVTLSGSYSLVDGANGLASNYQLPTAGSTVAAITPAPLTAGSFTATNRAYDGSTTVAVSATGATLTGVIGGDSVSVDLSGVTSGTVANKNVGTGKAVTVSGISITGTDAGNYRLTGSDTVTVDITPKVLTVNGLTVDNREYDRSVNIYNHQFNRDVATLSGAVSGDQVTLDQYHSISGVMADKNVGTSKPVTVTGLRLRGADAGNYAVQQGSVVADITPQPMYIYLSYTNNGYIKTYDGSAAAGPNVYLYNYYGIGGDNLTWSATSIGYADKNVAYDSNGQVTNKTITANGITLAGTDAGNYALQNTSTTLTGRINPRPLAVSGVSAVDRVYDGTRDVTVNIGSATVDTSNVVPGDQVSVATPGSGSVTGQMADKHVGTNKAVTVPGLGLTGTDAGNYSITSGSGGGVVVNITPKPVTVTYTALDKVYNFNTFATIEVTSPDIVTGDQVNFYVDQDVCGANACGRANFTAAGIDSNGNFTATRHVGSNRTVAIRNNFIYSGADSGNYTLTNPNGTAVASITPRPLTVTYNGGTRVYDGGVDAPVTLRTTTSGTAFDNSTVYYLDNVTVTQTAEFTGASAKNVGTGKPISVSNISFGGTDAGNYTVGNTTYTGATGSVTARTVTLSGIVAADRPYDGTTTVAVSAPGAVTSSGFVAGDIVSVSPPPGGYTTGTIANKNVGTNKPVTVTGLSLTGADAANYAIDPAGSGITVNITPAALTPTFTGVTRAYNGGVAATVTSTTSGILSGDVVNVAGTAVFTGLNADDAGTNKPISVTGITLSGSGAANYSLASTTATAFGTITPKLITASYTGSSRVYNGLADVSAPVVGSSLGFIAGDSVSFAQTAVFTGDGSAGVGKAVQISGITLGGTDAGNYALQNTSASTTATITQRPLGVTGITATNRVYDGTTTVAVNTANATVDLSNVIGGDQVSAVLPPGGISFGAMADRNAGNNKPVNVTGITLSGAQASNYAAVGATGLTVNIAPLALTASFTAADKVYDGSMAALITGTSTGVLPVDAASLGLSATGVFAAGKNVGQGLTVNVSGAFLTGAARDNYALTNTSGTTTASITQRTLTVQFNGQNKVYDGTTSATVTPVFQNLVSGDQVASTQTAVFTDNKNVGTGKPISVSGTALSGADAGNYLLQVSGNAVTGSITPRPITVSGLSSVTAQDRLYDGTRTVNLTVPAGITLTPSSADIIAGDTVQIDVPGSGVVTGTMADKNVARDAQGAVTSKPVTVDGLSLTGADSANYAIAGTAGVRVTITPLPISATFAGVNRVYNGNNSASVTGTSAGLLSGDLVTIAGSGFFADSKNVGTGKPITVTSALLSGTDARNYALTTTSGSATADVTPLLFAPTFTGGSRVYDGTATAPVTPSYNFYAGDNVSFSGTAVFSGSATTAKNVGSNKAITVSGITLSGTDAANYGLTTTTASTTGSITPRPLALTGLTGITASDRVYDGSTTVQITVQGSGTVSLDRSNIIGSDDVNVAQLSGNLTTGTMADKNVGSNKAVVVSGLALTGADAANYMVAATQGVTVNITPKNLAASFTGVNKVYDGTDVASLTGSSTDIIGGDTVTVSGNGLFVAGKNVGTGLAISVTGGTLSGTDARNYTLINATGSATADITPRSVTASFSGGTRVYDGTLAAPVTGTVVGLISGDSVTLGQTAVFGDKNAGTNKAVSITGIALSGTDAANYALSGGATAVTTATITPRPLGVIGLTGVTATDRVYDGTRNVVVNVGNTGSVTLNQADIIAGDTVTLTTPSQGTTTGLLLDKNAGNNKPVAVAGLTLGGADAANYSVASTSGVTVNILPKPLTATWAGQSKVYDGTDVATLLGSSLDIIGGDAVTISGNGVFAAGKNVGSGLVINVSGGTLGGADASNYLLGNATGTATADITPRTLGLSYAGVNRVYDGTNAATVTRTVTGAITGDTVSVSESAVFAAGKNVGNGLTVTISGIGLSGADAGNYQLAASSASTTANITPRDLNVTGLTGITAVDRAYDGGLGVQVNITGNPGTASGNVLPGDNVQINVSGSGLGQGQMLDKHVGINKPVALTGLTLSGADAGNYRISGTAGVTVNITPLDVTVSGLRAIDRVYDGTTVVGIDTSQGSFTGVLVGDNVQLLTSATAALASKNVGTQAVLLSGLTMGGTDAGNYRVVGSGPGLTATITPRTLNVGLTTATKVYDGTTGAGNATLFSDAIAGDNLTVNASTLAFASRNAGSGVAVSATGLSLAGADAGNYLLGTTSVSGTGTITPAPLTVAARSFAKTYGESWAFGSGDWTAQGLVAGETLATVALSSAGAAGSAGVAGSPYAITVGNVGGNTSSGFDAANYNLTVIDGQLTVTPRPLTIAGNLVVHEYDTSAAQRAVGVGFGVTGLANGDQVASVTQPLPSQLGSARGGSYFVLPVSNAVFGSGSATNYAISYVPGGIAIKPPVLSGDVLAVTFDAEQVPNALNLLGLASSAGRVGIGADNLPVLPGAPLASAGADAVAAELAAMLSGDGRRINVPTLQKLPLISLDPLLRRLMSNSETSTAP